MDIETSLQKDYETQHFGFHPRGFVDKVYNGFLESLLEALTQLKKYLGEEYSKVVSVEVINVNTEALFQKLVKKLDTAIDRLELYLDANVFKIPKHAVLPEDEVHITHPCTAKDDEDLDKELDNLKHKILEERTRRYILKLKIAEQKSIKEELVMLENKLEEILIVINESRVTRENLKVTVEKIQKLFNQLKQPLEPR